MVDAADVRVWSCPACLPMVVGDPVDRVGRGTQHHDSIARCSIPRVGRPQQYSKIPDLYWAELATSEHQWIWR